MTASRLAAHLTALATVTIWGITFISTRVLLESFTPFEILYLRFFLGWLALLAINRAFIPFTSIRAEILLALAGLAGVTLYFLLENFALTLTTVANVSVTVSTAPFFTGLLAWKFLKTGRPHLNFFLGFVIAISGIAMLSFTNSGLLINPLGDLLALLAAIAWAVYSIFIRKLSELGFGSLLLTQRVFFYGLLEMLPYFLLEPFELRPELLFTVINLGNLLFLGLLASALCFATWTFCIRQLGATLASAYIYLVPAISIITAWIILDEPLSLMAACGCVLTIAGLIIAEMRNLPKKPLTARVKER